MKGVVAAIILGVAVAGSSLPHAAAAHRALFNCAPVAGAAELFAAPTGAMIVIDGAAEPAAAAAGALGCLSAANGEQLLLVGDPETTNSLEPYARTFATGGGRARFAAGAPDALADDPATAGDALAAALETALRAPADRRIVAAAAPSASRGAVGLTQETWRPLGARLAPETSLTLRAEASTLPGIRVKLRPFEDIPTKGAALRYDGLIEVGPLATAPGDLRGR